MIIYLLGIMILGLLAEFISVYFLLSDHILFATLIHVFISIGITLLYKLFLTPSFQEVKWGFYTFMSLLCACIPLFGMLLSFFIVYSMYRLHTKFHQYAEVLDDAVNLDELQPLHAHYGSGGARIHLLNKNDVPKERTKALLKLSQSNLADMNPIISQLLPDTSDEMRLLAFNILNEQESTIIQKIDELLALLDMEHLSSNTQAQYHKQIAILYWELIYHHLISTEIEAVILDKACSYALLALNVLTNDATLWALLGKIYKHLKQYDKAKTAFLKALSYQVPKAQILPYLAEIEFNAGNYQAMQTYLNASDTLLDIRKMAPIQRFWNKK